MPREIFADERLNYLLNGLISITSYAPYNVLIMVGHAQTQASFVFVGGAENSGPRGSSSGGAGEEEL